MIKEFFFRRLTIGLKIGLIGYKIRYPMEQTGVLSSGLSSGTKKRR